MSAVASATRSGASPKKKVNKINVNVVTIRPTVDQEKMIISETKFR
jgi:hypothetical protein